MVAKEHGAGNWRHSLDCPFSAPIEWPILKVGVVRDRRLERRGKKGEEEWKWNRRNHHRSIVPSSETWKPYKYQRGIRSERWPVCTGSC